MPVAGRHDCRRRRPGRGDELADGVVDGPVNVQQRRLQIRRRRVVVVRMAGVEEMPKVMPGAMKLAERQGEKVPIVPRQQIADEIRLLGDAGLQVVAKPSVSGPIGRIGIAVADRVVAAAAANVGQQRLRVAARHAAAVVRSPLDEMDTVHRFIEPGVGDVGDGDPPPGVARMPPEGVLDTGLDRRRRAHPGLAGPAAPGFRRTVRYAGPGGRWSARTTPRPETCRRCSPSAT